MHAAVNARQHARGAVGVGRGRGFHHHCSDASRDSSFASSATEITPDAPDEHPTVFGCSAQYCASV